MRNYSVQWFVDGAWSEVLFTFNFDTAVSKYRFLVQRGFNARVQQRG